MSIKIVVSDTVGFKVKGIINDEAGTPKPFDFGLTCSRMDTDDISTKLKTESDVSIIDFLADVVLDWSGVKDEADKPVPYSENALRQLCKIAGVGGIAFRTYLAEVGAKEKN